MPETVTILLTGDQIAGFVNQPSNPPGINPGQDGYGMVIQDAAALTGPETIYRLVGRQLGGKDHFANGQFWDLQIYTGPTTLPLDEGALADPANWSAVPGLQDMGVRGDFVNDLGDGDEHVVFEARNLFLIYDLNGGFTTTPTDLFYGPESQIGDPDEGNNDGLLQFNETANAFNPICFRAGTLITTADGPVPIESLAVGDLVLTRDNGLQPIRWIARSEIGLARTVIDPSILPIRIGKGALGHGMPLRDLYLSPQHRVLVGSKIVSRMTGESEALVAAKQLCGLDGVTQQTAPGAVVYYHMRLDAHGLVCAEGLWAETLLLGKQALRSLSPEARRELATIFPGLTETTQQAARIVVPGRMARQMVQRHLKNEEALVAYLHAE